MSTTPHLKQGKRVIVKIGSALLVDKERGTVKRGWLETLGADLMKLRARGQEVLIVSSGAIAVGRRHLGLAARGKLKLEESQAAAAAGMVRLAHAYQEVMGPHGVTVAQVLLTLDDSENRRRYLNARNTIDQIIRLGAVPLINENDTVATDEIKFGSKVNEALWAAAHRLDIAEFKFFVVSLSVQQETGGNLAETLGNLSEILRRRKQMRLKIKAMSSEAKASAMILGALPFLMFCIIYLMNPEYETVLFTDPRGRLMLAAGLGAMGSGILVMAKMVRFEI